MAVRVSGDTGLMIKVCNVFRLIADMIERGNVLELLRAWGYRVEGPVGF